MLIAHTLQIYLIFFQHVSIKAFQMNKFTPVFSLNRLVFTEKVLHVGYNDKNVQPIDFTQNSNLLRQLLTTLTWNNFQSKLRQMVFYGGSSGFPTQSQYFSIYGDASRVITHKQVPRSAHVYVFTSVRSHLHRSFPLPVCSWHISHLTLAHYLFSPGFSLAEEVPSQSLFYYAQYQTAKAVVNHKMQGIGGYVNYYFQLRITRQNTELMFIVEQKQAINQ